MRAINSANAASKIIRKSSLSIRKKVLNDISNMLIENKDKIIELMVLEGHPVKLAEWEFIGMQKICDNESLNFFKKELWKNLEIENNEQIYLVRKPDGVVCISPPKNAPSNSILGIFALLVGNSVIVKPPLRSPLLTIFLWRRIIVEALKKRKKDS